jgi:phage tail sheath protein FI
MTQNDIDSGRVIAEVGFVAAQPIQQIRVTLSLTDARARAREVA